MPLLLLLAGCGLGPLVDELTAPEVMNPFQGADELTLTLRCQGDARAVLAKRLDRLDLVHTIASGADGGLAITVEEAALPGALARLLATSPDLSFQPVAEDQSPVLPRHDRVEEAALDAVPDLRPDVAFDPDAMHALLEGGEIPLPPVDGVRLAERHDRQVFAAPPGADWSSWLGSLPLLPGTTTALECATEGEARLCSPVILEEPAAVTAADVKETSLEIDPQFGQPYLSVTFGAAGKDAFGALTARLVDRELAIVSEGQILSRPRVKEAITGGKAQISVGFDPDGDALQQLWRVHVALSSGPLPGRCTVVE